MNTKMAIKINIDIFKYLKAYFLAKALDIFEKYLSIDADLPCEMSPTIKDCIPTNKAISPQNVGLINLNKTGTDIIEINFGNILLIR